MAKLTRIDIKDFRLFQNKTFYIGSMITAIAGQNGTGKSNILGLIANSIELRRTDINRNTFFYPKIFRPDFSKLFKAKREHDPTGSEKGTFYFDDGDYRKFRVTWQKGTRLRIIPYIDKGETRKRSDSKKTMAPIYLGLSRLYPFGESSECECQNIQRLDQEACKWIASHAQQILSTNHQGSDDYAVDLIKTNEAGRKRGIGFNTNKYSSLSNSAGQDNVGQILCAVWKLKKLKEDLGNDFPGAILLIDELDATLHPASQKKLFELLKKEARQTDFQVIFTTHSFFILELLTRKIEHNSTEEQCSNKIELNYITTANGSLECLRNPKFELIKNDLAETVSPRPQKIKVYCEDDEARWILKQLLHSGNYLERIQVVEGVSMGCKELLSLLKGDPVYFGGVLLILDGDVKSEEIKDHPNACILPGENSPEKVLIDFLCNMDLSEDFFNQDELMEKGVTMRNMLEHRNRIEEKQGEERRIAYKKWFNELRPYFEEFNLMFFWEGKNVDSANLFREDFAKAFNRIAQKMRIPTIGAKQTGQPLFFEI